MLNYKALPPGIYIQKFLGGGAHKILRYIYRYLMMMTKGLQNVKSLMYSELIIFNMHV